MHTYFFFLSCLRVGCRHKPLCPLIFPGTFPRTRHSQNHSAFIKDWKLNTVLYADQVYTPCANFANCSNNVFDIIPPSPPLHTYPTGQYYNPGPHIAFKCLFISCNLEHLSAFFVFHILDISEEFRTAVLQNAPHMGLSGMPSDSAQGGRFGRNPMQGSCCHFVLILGMQPGPRS